MAVQFRFILNPSNSTGLKWSNLATLKSLNYTFILIGIGFDVETKNT